MYILQQIRPDLAFSCRTIDGKHQNNNSFDKTRKLCCDTRRFFLLILVLNSDCIALTASPARLNSLQNPEAEINHVGFKQFKQLEPSILTLTLNDNPFQLVRLPLIFQGRLLIEDFGQKEGLRPNFDHFLFYMASIFPRNAPYVS